MIVNVQYFYLDELKSLGPCEVVRCGEKYATFRRADGSTLEMEITRLSWATQAQLKLRQNLEEASQQEELSEVLNE